MTDHELLETLVAEMRNVNKRLDGIDYRLSNVEQDVRTIKLGIEHEINPKINLLLECQVGNSERFQGIETDLRDFKDDYVTDKVVAEIIEIQKNKNKNA